MLSRLGVTLAVALMGVTAVATPAGATPASVTIDVSLDRSTIRADNVHAATLTVDAHLTSGGAPLPTRH